jgi:hypothetical protein
MQLVRALNDAPDGRPMQWRMIEQLDVATADAVEFAVARSGAAAGPLTGIPPATFNICFAN